MRFIHVSVRLRRLGQTIVDLGAQVASRAGVELLLGAEAGIGLALVPKLLGGLLVQVQALSLGVGAKIAAHLGTLVPVQAQPTHGAQDNLRVLVGRAGGVGVVDAQDERAAVCTGESPVIDSGAGAADVQLARR